MSNRTTRRAILGGAATAALAAATSAATAEAASLSTHDRSILVFALGLEQLQAAFYTETERVGVLTGETAELARVVGGHERSHVRALRQILGSSAPAAPKFDFKGATESRQAFVRTAVAFEDLGVAAYKGQLSRIQSKGLLATVLAIHAVEARHAAWIRRLVGILPAAEAFDQAKPESVINSIVASTKFVVSSTASHNPGFTG